MGSRDSRNSDTPDLLPAVNSYIDRYDMFRPGDGIVIGVSGGPDSVSLLDLLSRLRKSLDLRLFVAHLNHQLRGPASDADHQFVMDLAAARDLPCFSDRATVSAAGSPEAAARDARFGFLREVMRDTGASRIALGHTRSDQAETVLMRLIRGAGPTGLGAIRPIRDGIWVRPLLAFSRQQIQAYVEHRNLHVRHDDSNGDTRFLRNRIRHLLLPTIASDYNPSIEAALARSAELIQGEDQLLGQQAESAYRKALLYEGKRKIILDEDAVFGYHIALQRRLLRTAFFQLRGCARDLDEQSVGRMEGLRLTPAGSIQVAADISFHRSSPWLILSRPTPAFETEVAVPGVTGIPEIDAFVETKIRPASEVRKHDSSSDPFCACFDLDEICGRLTLRNRRRADRFQPYGLSGTQKVSDLFINLKIPRPLRDEIPLLLGGQAILWVVGLRSAQSTAVTHRARTVLEVTLRGGWGGLIPSS
ncbi:MAG: tRNA lysidine(34) synthetase TilS [Candidatus Latescibacteria bacterium]|nr:tRNA lysidine(34) synthetase TilS [Candidatus Latescibacterota bacterium]